MNKHSFNRAFLALVFASFTAWLVGCASTASSTTVSYLSAPSRLRLSTPVYFTIHDQRPQPERQGDPGSFYLYTVDGADTNRVALVLGEDICRIMERKGITARARVGLLGEVAPSDGVVVRLSLLSWFGRLPSRALVTEKVVGAILGQPVYAEGRCRFSAFATHSGQTLNLGVAEGKSALQVSRQATIAKEGNAASALAADEAIAQFLQAFESHFAK